MGAVAALLFCMVARTEVRAWGPCCRRNGGRDRSRAACDTVFWTGSRKRIRGQRRRGSTGRRLGCSSPAGGRMRACLSDGLAATLLGAAAQLLDWLFWFLEWLAATDLAVRESGTPTNFGLLAALGCCCRRGCPDVGLGSLCAPGAPRRRLSFKLARPRWMLARTCGFSANAPACVVVL